MISKDNPDGSYLGDLESEQRMSHVTVRAPIPLLAITTTCTEPLICATHKPPLRKLAPRPLHRPEGRSALSGAAQVLCYRTQRVCHRDLYQVVTFSASNLRWISVSPPKRRGDGQPVASQGPSFPC